MNDEKIIHIQKTLTDTQEQLKQSIEENASLKSKNEGLQKLSEENCQMIEKSDKHLIQIQNTLTETEAQLKQIMAENVSLKSKNESLEKLSNENNQMIAGLQNDIESMKHMV